LNIRHYCLSDRLDWEQVEGEVVLFKTDEGKYYRLNRLGSLIWERLASGAEANLIAAEIKAKFAVEAAVIERDLADFLDSLHSEGLLKADD